MKNFGKFLRTISMGFLFFCSQMAFPQQTGWFWVNPLPQGNDIFGIQFFDVNSGYLLCDGGLVLKTTNGGTNWTQYIPEPTINSWHFNLQILIPVLLHVGMVKYYPLLMRD